jgi:hypothetical protein
LLDHDSVRIHFSGRTGFNRIWWLVSFFQFEGTFGLVLSDRLLCKKLCLKCRVNSGVLFVLNLILFIRPQFLNFIFDVVMLLLDKLKKIVVASLYFWNALNF